MQPPPNEPYVPVTLAQIYTLLQTTHSDLQQALNELRDLRTDVKDHEQRIRSLEKGRWPIPALSLVFAGVAAFAALFVLIR